MSDLRGVLMFPLPTGDADGVYTDENEVNWKLKSQNSAFFNGFAAWIDGDDAKAVYGLSSSGDADHPLVSAPLKGAAPQADAAGLAAAIDAWVARSGHVNPDWQKTRALVKGLQSKGKGTAHGEGDLGTQRLTLWEWLLAAAGIYFVSKYADRRHRGRR